jgi:aminodeoxyfutalosine deaminase
MDDFIARLPKAELHLHLEGTVGPEALWRLAERYGSPLSGGGREALDELYCTRNFGDFLLAYKTVCEHLRQPEDYEFIAYDGLRRLAGQNVRYAEIMISAGVMLWKGDDVAACFAGIERGARRAKEEFGIRVAWLFDAVRHFGPEAAMEVVRQAARLRGRGVVGFGIGGDERQAPAELFCEVFQAARSEGLRLSAHAGEAAGPESVRNALDLLGVERIGHGFSAAEDPALVDYLVERQVPIDICLTSNLRTGCIADLAEHPLRRYFDRGVALSLSTDDPALFGTDLNREYALARSLFGFTSEELTELARSSFRNSFLSLEEKADYLTAFEPDKAPAA